MSIIRWTDLREEEFKDAIKTTDGLCIIPIGCYEMHGQHLPVGTDVQEAIAVAEKAAELEPMCVFPAFEYGDVSGLINRKGSVILDPDVVMNLLANYCREIARNGFDKILLMNFHGGNSSLLGQFSRFLAHGEKKDYYVSVISPYEVEEATFEGIYKKLKENGSGFYPELLPEDEETIRIFIEEEKTDGHAGLMETSLMLAVNPEMVKLDRMNAVSGVSTGRADKLWATGLRFPGGYGMNYPNCYEGHPPVGATERIGKLLLRLLGEVIAKACKGFKDEFPAMKAHREKVWNDAKNDL